MTLASSPFARFGAFASFFQDSPDGPAGAYLPLLNLHPGAEPAIRRLKRAVRDSGPDLERSVIALLRGEAGWRPQLVGAAAMVAGPTSPACIDALWRAIDHYSFTSPQLAAAAYQVDPEFRAKAWPRMEGRCRVAPFAEAASEESEADQARSDPKLLAAFAALFERGQPRAEPLSQLLVAPDVVQLLSDDQGGGEIALDWLDSLESALAEMGD